MATFTPWPRKPAACQWSAPSRARHGRRSETCEVVALAATVSARLRGAHGQPPKNEPPVASPIRKRTIVARRGAVKRGARCIVAGAKVVGDGQQSRAHVSTYFI